MSGGATQPKLEESRTLRTREQVRSDTGMEPKPELPPDTVGYIAALCAELSAMARIGGCADLAYFLEMARVEAATILVRREEQPLRQNRKD